MRGSTFIGFYPHTHSVGVRRDTRVALRPIFDQVLFYFFLFLMLLGCASAGRQVGCYTCLGNIWKLEPLSCVMTDDSEGLLLPQQKAEMKDSTCDTQCEYVLRVRRWQARQSKLVQE